MPGAVQLRVQGVGDPQRQQTVLSQRHLLYGRLVGTAEDATHTENQTLFSCKLHQKLRKALDLGTYGKCAAS